MSTKEFSKKANAATILREIVSRVLNYPAHKIVLAGEIQPDHYWRENGGHSWWIGASEDYYKIFGFTPEKGLTPMDIKMSYAFSCNGESQPEGDYETLAEYCKRTGDNPVFIVQDHSGKEYGESGEEFRIITLYKTPDFQEYWNQVNEADVQRWAEWLGKK